MPNLNIIKQHRKELLTTLQDQIIPFWLNRSVDHEYGGFLTEFDENGCFYGIGAKNIVTQARMIWGFSALLPFAKEEDKERMQAAAIQGLDFFINHFWDKQYGGFYWLLKRDGRVSDPSKLTYGESFALYCLSQFALTYQSTKALEYAEKCFDLLQKYATDTLRGGYYENIEQDWSISPGGAYAGDRKSLDIHMHIMEAYTTLFQVTGKDVHRRKLQESWDIIKTHMINRQHGYGLNQFDLFFRPIPAIGIMRTWNAEREKNETIENPLDTTSYGHNVELSWLADHALNVLVERQQDDNDIIISFLDHAIKYGYDKEFGGIYRDGIGVSGVLVTDKEWWQNWESLVGFLNGYTITKNETYYDVFASIWAFVQKYFINHDIGESRQLLNRQGHPLVGNMGNLWKGIYHTGRAVSECIKRLDILLQ